MNNNTNIGFAVQHSNQIKHANYFKDHIDGIPDFSYNKLNKKEIATASFDKTINIYDIERLKKTNTLSAHSKGVWCCDYSSSDSLLLTGSDDHSFILWDTRIYQVLSHVKNSHSDTIYDVVFDENVFATCSKGKVNVWDAKKLDRPLSTFEFDNEIILSLTFSNNLLIAGFISGGIVMIDYVKNKVISEITIPFTYKPEDNLDSGNGVENILFRFII